MAFRPFLSSSGISPVVRGRWAGPLLLVYILWYNIYSLLCPDGRSRAAPPLSCCCGHCRCRRCPRRHLYCGGCRANPNIPPSSSSTICSARQNFLHFVSSSGVSLVVRGRWDNPLLLSAAKPPLLCCCGHCWCSRRPRPSPSSLWWLQGSSLPLLLLFSTWPNLLHFICFPSPVVRLLHFLLLPPSSLLPPLASKFLTESA